MTTSSSVRAPLTPEQLIEIDRFWRDAAKRFPAGSVVHGVVSHRSNYGIFVDIADQLCGFVHTSDPEMRLRGMPALKAEVTVEVVSLDQARHRIALRLVGEEGSHG